MDSNDFALVQAEIARLTSLVSQAAGNSTEIGHPQLSTPQTILSGDLASINHPSSSSQLPPPSQLSSCGIIPYQSAQRPSQPTSMRQPFLGFNNL